MRKNKSFSIKFELVIVLNCAVKVKLNCTANILLWKGHKTNLAQTVRVWMAVICARLLCICLLVFFGKSVRS